MKVLLAITYSKDDRYIEEYVDYYISLGIDKIVIGDFTPVKYEHQLIKSNKYEIWDRYDDDLTNTHFYNEIYQQYGKDYDWICMFTSEEYLMLPKYNNIKDFLSDSKFNNFNCIQINFKTYSDSGYLHYENKPIIGRFTEIYGDIDCKCNRTLRSIVRGKCKMKIMSKHGPKDKHNGTLIKRCDVLGRPGINNNRMFEEYLPQDYYNIAYLARYAYKSIEEFFIKRIYLENLSSLDIETQLNVFANHCNFTIEKQQIINELLNKYDRNRRN